jgi:hypothetical protein
MFVRLFLVTIKTCDSFKNICKNQTLLFIIRSLDLNNKRKNVLMKMLKSLCMTALRRLVVPIIFISPPLFGQHVKDISCFTIPLNQDAASLFWCGKGEDLRRTLCGPVIMDGQTLLFYSCNGYALYRPTGALVDSQSVIKENKKVSFDDPRRLKCAYPLDAKTLLYFKRSSTCRDSLEVYQKTLYRKGLSRYDGSAFASFKDIENSQLFNLAGSGIIDEMAPKSYLMPNLVGYTSLSSGKKWWSLDKFYSFLSPVIVMQDQVFNSFFPGILPDQRTEVEKQLISPLGTYWWQGKQYYFGVHSVLGTSAIESQQMLYLCDQAGNVLFNDQLMKQVLIDDVLEHDKKSNTDYTVKRFWQFVTVPAIDENGDAYYSICDYRTRTIEVRKRLFFRYSPRIINPAFEELIDTQKRYCLKPMPQECNSSRKNKSNEVVGIMVRDEHGKRRRATIAECTCEGYYAHLFRDSNTELKKRLSFTSNALPPEVKYARDSVARLSTALCPYTLSLYTTGNEEIRTFHYSAGDEVIAARVIRVTPSSDIFVRVDLKKWAEVVVFSKGALSVNRFTFNTEDCQKRKDIVAVCDDGTVIEEDYEHIPEDYTYFKWELSELKEK